MKVLVNDQEVEVGERISVAALLAQLGYPDKGVAVAVDWAVIPRSGWHAALAEGSRIEVVTAVQGG
jgi:sulfur carrier protein